MFNPMLTGLRLDLRAALRVLRRHPGFVALAVLTLALGIGANTAVYSVLHAVLLRPLPWPEGERLVMVRQEAREHGGNIEFSYPDFADLREQGRTFSALGTTAVPRRFVHDGGDEARPAMGAMVSADLFDVLGAEPLIGRHLQPEDSHADAAPVVVLTEDFWRSRFGGSPSVLGSAIRLDGESFTVVGVMPAEATYPREIDFWAAVEPAIGPWAESRQVGFLSVVGRLAPGVDAAAAAREADAILSRVPERESGPFAGAIASVASLREELIGPARPALLVLLAGASLVLLIACVNVASMLLALGASRRQERAVKMALGASRMRIMRASLVEALLIALVGAAAGVALCVAAMDPLVAMTGASLYRAESIGIMPGVLAFTLLLTLVVAALVAIVPALRQTNGAGAGSAAGSGGRTTRSGVDRRISDGIVAAEAAVAFLVLAATGLVLQSFARLQAIDLGYERDGRLTVELFAPQPPDAEPSAYDRFFDALVPRIEALPGVRSASAILLRPLNGPEGHNALFTAEGQTEAQHRQNPFVNLQAAMPGYFTTMGIGLRGGRDFDGGDREDGQRVVIVSEALAAAAWPGEDPVGKRIKLAPPEAESPWMTVVGVAESARYRSLREVSLDVYLPYTQYNVPLNHLVLRTEPGADAAAISRHLRAAVAETSAAARVVDIASVDGLVDPHLAQPRFQATLLGLFALLALLLGAVGTYGVLAFVVARRKREFAIRLALGVDRRQLLRGVVARALGLGAAGIVLGGAIALFAGRLLERLVFGVDAFDPVVFGGSTVLLLAASAAAAWVPARRAARGEVMEVLRAE